MRTEVHVHGSIVLVEGVTASQVEGALRPWLDYLDVASFKEARSLEQDEPGIVFDRKRYVLEVCWTGDVGRNFQGVLGDALAALGPLSEEAATIEITYFHDKGDEVQLMFVGPTPQAIHDLQRRLMVEEVSNLLGRQFGAEDVSQVAAVINRLFAEDWQRKQAAGETAVATATQPHTRPKQLH
jgi:hypothetical protein